MKASIVGKNRNYMHRFKTIALCILLMLSCAPLFSKSKSKVDLRYAFGSTIDLQCGYSVMPYSVAGEARNAYGASSGSVFQMRYTYFSAGTSALSLPIHSIREARLARIISALSTVRTGDCTSTKNRTTRIR